MQAAWAKTGQARLMRRCLAAAVLTGLMLLLCPVYAKAETAAAFKTDYEYYFSKTKAPKKGVIAAEILRFRSYPYLDLAYRMRQAGRLPEAKAEFEKYFQRAPDDVRARVSYLALLESMSLYNEAAAEAEQIAARWPRFVPAWLHKGLAHRQLNQQKQAYAAFIKAVGEQDVLKNDLVFALSMAAETAMAIRSYDDAVKQLQRLSRIDGRYKWTMQTGLALEKSHHFNNAMQAYLEAGKMATSAAGKSAALLAAGNMALKLNNRKTAYRCFQQAQIHDPGNVAAIRGLAQLAYQDGEYERAEGWLKRLERAALAEEDRLLLVNIHIHRQNQSAAIKELESLIKMRGGSAGTEMLEQLANLYEETGRLSESISLFQTLSGRHPKNGRIRLRYASLLTKSGQYKLAETELNRALQRGLTAQDKAAAHSSLALVYEKRGLYEKAAREFEIGIQQPPQPEALIRYAALLGKANQPEKSLTLLNRVLNDAKLPDRLRHRAYFEKSLIFENKGQYAAAATEMEHAVNSGNPLADDSLIRLAALLQAAGRPSEALMHLERVLGSSSASIPAKRRAHREQAAIFEQTGQVAKAAQAYESAVRLGDSAPENFLRLANLYRSASKTDKASHYYNLLLRQKGLPQPVACAAREGMGLLYLKQADYPNALAQFSDAVKSCGRSWQRYYYLGLANYNSKQWLRALSYLTLAAEMHQEPAVLMYIALCHKELHKPGIAIYYLLAAHEASGSQKELGSQILATLGYLYTDEFAFEKAADAFRKSLELKKDITISVKLAKALMLAGKTGEGWKSLATIDSGKLTAEQQIEFADIKAGLLQQSGKNEEALAVLEGVQKIAPASSRSYSMGLLCLKLGQTGKAVEYLSAAQAKEPTNSSYALSLGYAYKDNRQYHQAIKKLEWAVSKNPDVARVYNDIAYLHMKTGDNDKAEQWFKTIIDRFPVLPLDGSAENDALQRDAQRIKGEIAKLDSNVKGIAYYYYRTGKAQNSINMPGGQISGGLTGQTGIELSVRPPLTGFVDDRQLEFFSRIYGNSGTGSLNYNQHSSQAGFGVRYKPFRTENLWLSGERLVKIGDAALDEWLFRLLYSRGSGAAPVYGINRQNYTLLYGDVDYYVRSATTAAYLEARKGVSYRLGSAYMLIPHLIFDGQWKTPFAVGGNFIEGGAGVSVKFFFNGTRYIEYRNIFDISMHYKHGMFMDSGVRHNTGEYDTLILGAALFF